jgi:predicted GH43/DUF377 family glycosyl hydrolase
VFNPRRLGGNWALIHRPAPPLLETTQEWLVIYHDVKQSYAGCIYRLGLALFDLNKPELLLKRSKEWVFALEEPYEQRGDVNYVMFPCGYTIGPDVDTINLYYGSADTSISLTTRVVFARCWIGLTSTANKIMIMHLLGLNEIVKHMTFLESLWRKNA